MLIVNIIKKKQFYHYFKQFSSDEFSLTTRQFRQRFEKRLLGRRTN